MQDLLTNDTIAILVGIAVGAALTWLWHAIKPLKRLQEWQDKIAGLDKDTLAAIAALKADGIQINELLNLFLLAVEHSSLAIVAAKLAAFGADIEELKTEAGQKKLKEELYNLCKKADGTIPEVAKIIVDKAVEQIVKLINEQA